MHLRSEHFAIDDLQLKDKENIRALAESRPWIKGLLRFKDSLPDADKFNVFDYFETLWNDYIKMDFFWCIYRKDGEFCGDVQWARDGEDDYRLYIQIMEDARIDGLGKELFERLISEIVEETGAKHLEYELWNDKDRSKEIFEEAGYNLADGYWQYEW